MPSQENQAVIIAGPTASGKSAAAIDLAAELDGEIVCADSMQVYRDLRIVTARPSPADEATVPHHLYGHVDGSERYSAGRFASEAAEAIRDIQARGRVPILCGGTGLYLRALTEGLSPIPPVPTDVTEEMARAFDRDPAGFRERLLATDPGQERLAPSDRQRHIRAAAVLAATGRTLGAWQKRRGRPVLRSYRAAVLLPSRQILYERCEARFSGMLAEGALQEVRALLARCLASDLPVMKALGVPELRAVIEEEAALEDAAAQARQETRRFAKRQTTWFRNQTAWPACGTAEALIAQLRDRA